MAVQPTDHEITHDHDWPSFLEIRIQKTRQHADELYRQIEHLRIDRLSGWIAAAMLLGALGITLYQWLGSGWIGETDGQWIFFGLGMVGGALLGALYVSTAPVLLQLLQVMYHAMFYRGPRHD